MNTPGLPAMLGAGVLAFTLTVGGVAVAESAGAGRIAATSAAIGADVHSVAFEPLEAKKHRKKHHKKHSRSTGRDTPLPDVSGTPGGGTSPGGGTPGTSGHITPPRLPGYRGAI